MLSPTQMPRDRFNPNWGAPFKSAGITAVRPSFALAFSRWSKLKEKFADEALPFGALSLAFAVVPSSTL